MVGAVLATCLVAATALTLTYEVTRERILEQERAAERGALQAVLPEAAQFEAAEGLLGASAEAAGDVPVQAVYRGYDDGGVLVGWGVRLAPRGYGGPVTMVVGLDRDGSVSGVSIITQNETPGLGTKILTVPGWLAQFEGWQSTDVKGSASGFDAIAGATRSSVAVRNGVTAAAQVHVEVLVRESGEEGGGS